MDAKRIIDFLIAAGCLIIFSPLFLICYIAVKWEDGGPAFYQQERIGLHGKPFFIYKFRSMRVDAEKDGSALYQHEKDDRMTKVGKFLRDHHLDELPQLWNVLKGDMAFIGLCSKAIWRLLVPVLNGNTISTRLFSAIPDIRSYIRYDQE